MMHDGDTRDSRPFDKIKAARKVLKKRKGKGKKAPPCRETMTGSKEPFPR